MADDSDRVMLRTLREMCAEIGELRQNSVTKADFESLKAEVAESRSDMRSLGADVASDLLVMRKELSAQIVSLRRAVVDCHTSVIGHGMLISDLGSSST